VTKLSWNIIEATAFHLSKGDPTFQGERDRLFARLADLCIKTGVRENHVSIIGLAAAAIGAVVLFNPLLAAVFLVINLLCDGLDGVIARRRGAPTRSGEIIDITCDTVSLLLLALGLKYYDFIPLNVYLFYSFILVLYTSVSAKKHLLLTGRVRSIGSRVVATSAIIIILLMVHLDLALLSVKWLSALALNAVAGLLLTAMVIDGCWWTIREYASRRAVE
jgi:phosphatidylglycerophosphate synthase